MSKYPEKFERYFNLMWGQRGGDFIDTSTTKRDVKAVCYLTWKAALKQESKE